MSGSSRFTPVKPLMTHNTAEDDWGWGRDDTKGEHLSKDTDPRFHTAINTVQYLTVVRYGARHYVPRAIYYHRTAHWAAIHNSSVPRNVCQGFRRRASGRGDPWFDRLRRYINQEGPRQQRGCRGLSTFILGTGWASCGGLEVSTIQKPSASIPSQNGNVVAIEDVEHNERSEVRMSPSTASHTAPAGDY